MTRSELTRREALATLGTGGAFLALPGCAAPILATPVSSGGSDARALLDSIAE